MWNYITIEGIFELGEKENHALHCSLYAILYIVHSISSAMQRWWLMIVHTTLFRLGEGGQPCPALFLLSPSINSFFPFSCGWFGSFLLIMTKWFVKKKQGTDSERRTRGLVASSNIRKLSTGGKPQQKQCHCPKKQQLFRLIPSFTTGRQLYILKFRHGVRFCSERAVERKDPLVKYGGCDSKSFQIVDLVGRIMTVVACTTMWDR